MRTDPFRVGTLSGVAVASMVTASDSASCDQRTWATASRSVTGQGRLFSVCTYMSVSESRSTTLASRHSDAQSGQADVSCTNPTS